MSGKPRQFPAKAKVTAIDSLCAVVDSSSGRFQGLREQGAARPNGIGRGIGRMKVLVVEDEPLLAMLLEESLVELGHEVAGSAATVEQALATLDGGEVDFALLDYSLADETTAAPVAARLRGAAIPFVYLTGHRSLPLGEGIPKAPLLNKPFTLDQLDDALRDLPAAA